MALCASRQLPSSTISLTSPSSLFPSLAENQQICSPPSVLRSGHSKYEMQCLSRLSSLKRKLVAALPFPFGLEHQPPRLLSPGDNESHSHNHLATLAVGIKRLLNVLEVTAIKLVLLVQKLLLLVLKVNVAERLQLLKG
ncbi:hypothetical protein Tco_1099044 [Tanacetum coccineum]